MKRTLSRILTFILMLTLLVGTGTGALADGAGQWKIGYNMFGSAAYALVALADNSKQAVGAFGGIPVMMDDEFSVEKIVQDVENMIASGCDGILIWLPAEALYPSVAQLCADAQVPFVLNDKVPEDPAIVAELKANPYFAGAIGPANAVYGASIAEYALSMGYKTCIIASADLGDPTDAPRLEVFKKVFTEGGGEILDELHAATAGDTQPQVENALIAHPNPDFIYGTGSDFGNGSSDALKGKGFDTVVMTSGLDATALSKLADPDDPMVMVNGDYWICGMLSAIILQNYLDGTPLKDANGEPVWFTDVMPFQVPAEQYDLYKKFFLDQFMYTPEEIQQFSGANNPDFNYDAFMKLISDYSLENRLLARYSDGSVTADELIAVGINP